MKVALACALLLAASGVSRADISVGIYANVPGEAVPSVDVFYDQLAPYGQWVQDPDVGDTVFVPDDARYVPYTNGHWEYTDVGMVWVSSEPFAWATSHYGRWYYSDTLGRWAWLPDTQWGPSWVDWRESGDTFGWAPIPPRVIIERGYREPIYAWHYAPAGRLYDPDLDRYYVGARDVPRYHRAARQVQQYGRWQNRQIVVGPPPTVLRQHNVTVQPRRIEPRAMGRVNPGELRQRAPAQPQPRPQIQPRAVQPQPQPRPQIQPRAVQPQPQPRAVEPQARPRFPSGSPMPVPRAQPQPRAAQPQPRAAQPQPRGRDRRDQNDHR